MENGKTIYGRAVKPVAPPRPKSEAKVKRKTRNDKKQDVKFKVLPHEKKKLKLMALDNKSSLTEFCSNVAKKYLISDIQFNDYAYDHNGQFVHVLLEQDFFKMVETLTVEWDISRRKVIHRLIKEYLARNFGGVEINDYRERIK